jgi:hypothetical protein
MSSDSVQFSSGNYIVALAKRNHYYQESNTYGVSQYGRGTSQFAAFDFFYRRMI